MDKKYICYCGLYCENCAVKTKIAPAAIVLYDEMRDAGFADVIDYIPGSGGFWPFLKGMAEGALCPSCKDGGGNPGCTIRICAKEKEVEMCALCGEYPCDRINAFTGYPDMKPDNELLRTKGMDAWAALQDERRKNGFTYPRTKNVETIIESRCGILCGECEYREKMNCAGCVSIDKPFWGDSCPVKSCCENRDLEHCGLCGDFPCDLLNQFAYDKDQGDDGKRIEQCKKWAGDKRGV